MNATLNQIANSMISLAGIQLLQFTLLFACLTILSGLLRKHLRASVRYGLFCLLLVKLVLPPTLALPTGIGYWIGHTDSMIQVVQRLQPWVSGRNTPVELDTNTVKTSAAEQGKKPLLPAETSSNREAETAPLDRSRGGYSFQFVLMILWVAGMVSMLFLTYSRHKVLTWGYRDSKPAGPELRRLLESCQKQLSFNRKIGIEVVEEKISPSVVGFFRPVIYLPEVLLDRLDSEQLRLILLHELYHLRRGDPWINLLQIVLQIVYFYNPLLWVANANIRRLREESTDEAVLSHRDVPIRAYSKMLLDSAEAVTPLPVHVQTMALCVAEGSSRMGYRIQQILRKQRPGKASAGWWGYGLCTVLACVLLPMAPASVEIAREIAADGFGFEKQTDLSIADQISKATVDAFHAQNTEDWDRYYDAFSSDFIGMFNGSEPSIGLPAFKAMSLSMSQIKVTYYPPEYGDLMIFDCGEYIVETGNLQLHYDIQNRPVKFSELRKYLTIWRRDAWTGDLKVQLLIYNQKPTKLLARVHAEPQVYLQKSDSPFVAVESDPELQDLEHHFEQAFVEERYDEAVAYYAQDAILIPLDDDILYGKDTIGRYVLGRDKRYRLVESKFQPVQIRSNGTIAYIANVCWWKFEDTISHQELTVSGKNLHLWKKDAEGRWKLFIDIHNTNQPNATRNN